MLNLYTMISKVWFVTISAFSLFLLGRNSRLSKKNEALNTEVRTQEKLITIQNKVIDVVQNTHAVDIDANIKRMYDGKL